MLGKELLEVIVNNVAGSIIGFYRKMTENKNFKYQSWTLGLGVEE